MTDGQDRLRSRLFRLEAAAPTSAGLAALPQARRRRYRVSVAMAAALVLAVASVAFAAGAFIDKNGVRSAPGLENDGQPFAGTGLHCMTPSDAQRLIVARGYTPLWQIDDWPGDGKSGGTTTFSDTAPDHGIVMGGFVLDKVAQVVVRVNADADPFPFPDCPR